MKPQSKKAQPKKFPNLAASAAGAALTSAALTAALLLPTLVARADTVVSTPSATSPGVTVVPGGPKRTGMRVAIVATSDTSGNIAAARRALLAANFALGRTPGFAPMTPNEYSPVPPGEVRAGAANVDWGYPFTATDYQKFGKALKAPRAMTIELTPGATGGTYNAVAELYDTKNGALVGRGEASSVVSSATTPALGQQNAVDASVAGAVFALSQTAQFSGIVISVPDGYTARLSLGEKDGVRQGARVEYLAGGTPFAYGTVIDVSAGDSVATVAPETAFPLIYPNVAVRIVNNPTRERAGLSQAQIDERDNARFERNFTVGAIGGAAIYYLIIVPRRH